jgi:dCTP deaminase
VPGDLTAQVAGRSSWGRLGLLIEAAPNISPGFRGCITLELINAGLAPLVLYPLMIVSQLVVLENVNPVTYEGRYRFPIGPEFSRLHEDAEMQFLADAENFR